MATVVLVDTAPSVRQLEWALQASCGALVTAEVSEIRVQIVQAIEAIRAALVDLRPAPHAGAGALAFGFVVAAGAAPDNDPASQVS